MPQIPDPSIVAEIEAIWRDKYAGSSEASLKKTLEFEMASVDIHRANLVPFVAGHGVRSGTRLLDFGSGPGCSAAAIAHDLGAHVVGVEPNAGNEVIAPRWSAAYGVSELTEFHFTQDTLHLPFEDASFDFVMTSSSLEYIKGDRGPYLREMVRCLKTGGRLIVAGTSNAAWPREVHSQTWTLNWMPNLGPKIRERLGKNPDAERGITFGAILAAAPELRFVKGERDELLAFAERVGSRAEALPLVGGFMTSAAHRVLQAVDRGVASAVDWPAEAFLPWLNVGFEKVG